MKATIAVNTNEIVVVDPGCSACVKTIWANNFVGAVGVALDNIAAGSTGRIAFGGIVNVINSTQVAASAGQLVITSGMPGDPAGRAAGTLTPNAGASIGVWLENVAIGGTGKILLR
jgi:hypothetical protein